ncbi:chemotaxis protein CheW [Calidifontibacillus oryziterrae]|uniref:chemotaxis protein CheW n=1 Tax=Calidifontibacillus oryziterrae TaxID=1191699 RepID=UPI0002EDD263|nr:chemotaxis protein CheW [Calidifontibacillus oryziterrae]
MDINHSEKVVTFKMGAEYFGISIFRVMSIEKTEHITRMPDLPQHIKGILNLRGDIIPIIDLRQFMLKTIPNEYDSNRIIVVKVDNTLAGLIVDEATEVLDIPNENVQGISLAGSDLNRFMKVAKVNDKLVMILDIEALVKESDIANAINEVKGILNE